MKVYLTVVLIDNDLDDPLQIEVHKDFFSADKTFDKIKALKFSESKFIMANQEDLNPSCMKYIHDEKCTMALGLLEREVV